MTTWAYFLNLIGKKHNFLPSALLLNRWQFGDLNVWGILSFGGGGGAFCTFQHFGIVGYDINFLFICSLRKDYFLRGEKKDRNSMINSRRNQYKQCIPNLITYEYSVSSACRIVVMFVMYYYDLIRNVSFFSPCCGWLKTLAVPIFENRL